MKRESRSGKIFTSKSKHRVIVANIKWSMHKCILFKIVYLFLSTMTQSLDINQAKVSVLGRQMLNYRHGRIYALEERHFSTA